MVIDRLVETPLLYMLLLLERELAFLLKLLNHRLSRGCLRRRHLLLEVQ